MIKITELKFQHEKYGSWTYSVVDGITYTGGKPSPSEAEAHAFKTHALPLIEQEIALIMRKTFDVEY